MLIGALFGGDSPTATLHTILVIFVFLIVLIVFDSRPNERSKSLLHWILIQ
jgi:hypothetical protein